MYSSEKGYFRAAKIVAAAEAGPAGYTEGGFRKHLIVYEFLTHYLIFRNSASGHFRLSSRLQKAHQPAQRQIPFLTI